jgi:hypothetical protein
MDVVNSNGLPISTIDNSTLTTGEPGKRIRVTPSTTCMEVIAWTDDAVYLRLSRDLQEEIECACPHCKKNNGRGYWDTLLVPIKAETRKGFAYQFSSRVHMPNPHEFMEYIKAKKARVASVKS